MSMPPAVRAIYTAIASDDLGTMQHAMALGVNYFQRTQAMAEQAAADPAPPPAEGEEPAEMLDHNAILVALNDALHKLQAAIGAKERELRDKKRGSRR